MHGVVVPEKHEYQQHKIFDIGYKCLGMGHITPPLAIKAAL